MSIDIKKLKHDISVWADNIHYNMAVFIFGSCLKGKQDPNDIDIALIFTESLSRGEIELIIHDYNSFWEADLRKITKLKIHLQIYNPWYVGNLREYLINGPVVLLYLSEAHENTDEYFDKALDVLLNKE